MTHRQWETVERSLSGLSARDKPELVERLAQELRSAVATDRQESASRAGPLTEDEFKEQLLKTGFMTTLPTPPHQPGPGFQPVTIEGEPLSETIIRERR